MNHMPAFNIKGKKGQFLVATFAEFELCDNENKARSLCRERKDSNVYEWIGRDWFILCSHVRGSVINEYL